MQFMVMQSGRGLGCASMYKFYLPPCAAVLAGPISYFGLSNPACVFSPLFSRLARGESAGVKRGRLAVRIRDAIRRAPVYAAVRVRAASGWW